MNSKVGKCSILLALCLLLVMPMGIMGCGSGGDGVETRTVRVGYLGDFTGPAASAVSPFFDAMVDYLAMAREEGLHEGINVIVERFDSRTDFGRVPTGYTTLRDKGVAMLVIPNPMEVEIIVDRLERDHIPAVVTAGVDSLITHPWCFFQMATIQEQTKVLIQWIIDDWDNAEGRVPRVGIIGATTAGGYNTVEGTEGFVADNPGSIDYQGHRLASPSNTAWRSEIQAMSDCDYLLVATLGAGTSSLIKEARDREFKGKLLSGTSTIPGYWYLVRDVVDNENLYDIYHAHAIPWVGENPFLAQMREQINLRRPATYVKHQLGQSAYASGWAFGIWLVDALQRAVKDAGEDTIDGVKIREAIATTNLVVPGWDGHAWKIVEGQDHIINRQLQFYEWDTDDEEWQAITGWLSLQ